MTYKQFKAQQNDPERELFVSYTRRSANGEIVRNWGSYTSKAIFKRDWKWFKQQIISCNVIDRNGHNYFWRKETGWFEI